MKKTPYDKKQLHELLYQALETERGGVKIYETALSCVQNKDLKGEWEEYLEQTRTHEQVLLKVFDDLGLNPETETPGREVVAHLGDSLVKAMKLAKSRGSASAAQLVAGECVVLGETKDHQNWELIGHLAKQGRGNLCTQNRLRSGGTGRGPPPIPHQGLYPGAVDRVTRHASGPATPRGGENG